MQLEANTVIKTCKEIKAQGTWTTERMALLKHLVDAGLSSAQIAREIGVSRNAVIGKVHRLGLSRYKSPADTSPGPKKETRKNRNPAPRRGSLRALWAKPQLAAPEAPAESISRCSLMQLQEWHCRWPCGDPSSKDFGFCGNQPLDGLPYCPAHARIAYRPSTRELSRALRFVA